MPRRPANPVLTHGRNTAAIYVRLLVLEQRMTAVLRPRPVLRSETRLVAAWLAQVTDDLQQMTIAFSDAEREVQTLAVKLQRRLSARVASIADCVWPDPASPTGALAAVAHRHALTMTLWRATLPVFRHAMLPAIEQRLADSAAELKRQGESSGLRRPALEASVQAWMRELPGMVTTPVTGADEQRATAWRRLSSRLLGRATLLVWGPAHCERMVHLSEGLSPDASVDDALRAGRASWSQLGRESTALRQRATPDELVTAAARELALLLQAVRRQTRALEKADGDGSRADMSGGEQLELRARQMAWALRLLATDELLHRLVQSGLEVPSQVWTELARVEWWLHRHTATDRLAEVGVAR
ncbi:MAG: hypothetical protein KGO50_04700 [Myxococcales bacterium]|nr:hypothetical protein [Myxococcales bacterium]